MLTATENSLLLGPFSRQCWGGGGGEMAILYDSMQHITSFKNYEFRDFPGGTAVKNPSAKAGDMGSSPGPGRSHMPQSY